MQKSFTHSIAALHRRYHPLLTRRGYSTLFGQPVYQDKLSQVKKFPVIEYLTPVEDTSNNHEGRVVDMTVELIRKDRVEFMRKGPSDKFPAFNLEFTVQGKDSLKQSYRVDQLTGTTGQFIDPSLRGPGSDSIPFYFDGKKLSASPLAGTESRQFTIHLDSQLTNSQMLQFLLIDRRDANAAMIHISSKNDTDESGWIKIATVEDLKRSKHWCVIVDSVNYLYLLQTSNQFYLINLFCYHLGNPLLNGKLFTGRSMEPYEARTFGTESDEQNEDLVIECPTCEFKFTQLPEASYPVQVREGSLFAQIDLAEKRTGRPNMSSQSAETLRAYLELQNVPPLP